MIFINIKGPTGRQVYARGNYVASIGVAPVSVTTHPGTHTFEMLSANGQRVAFRGTVRDVPDGAVIDLELSEVLGDDVLPP